MAAPALALIAEADTPALRVEGVTLSYAVDGRTVTAVEDVSLDIRRGERLVLLGPSGCGKSSLLKSIGGFLPPAAGRVLLEGRPVSRPGPDRMMVLQDFEQLLPWLTVRRNLVAALAWAKRTRRAEAEATADDMLQRVGLARVADQYPNTLSGGMKQRVAIARALALRPEVLLMDEPFAALDAMTRRRMQEELLALCEDTGVTTIFVTHAIDEAIVIGSRIVVMTAHPGRIRAVIDLPGGRGPDRGDPAFAALEARIGGLIADQIGGGPRRRRPMVDYQGLLQAGSPLRPAAAETPVRRWIGTGAWRRLLILAALAAVWEVAARLVGSPLLLPGFLATLAAFGEGVASGELPLRTLASLQVLVAGYAIGVVAAAVLAGLATASRLGAELLSTLTAMFNPLPAIALLPIALLWFGLGTPSLLFVIVHSVLWPLALAAHSGFRAVPRPLAMVGQNLGLSGAAYVVRILVPAAFPAILAGLKIGWAFAWRTLIAAELVVGVSSRSGGLGWFIYVNRNQLETANVFAGLLAIILIGLLVESLLFRTLSRLTVERWGTQNP